MVRTGQRQVNHEPAKQPLAIGMAKWLAHNSDAQTFEPLHTITIPLPMGRTNKVSFWSSCHLRNSIALMQWILVGN